MKKRDWQWALRTDGGYISGDRWTRATADLLRQPGQHVVKVRIIEVKSKRQP